MGGEAIKPGEEARIRARLARAQKQRERVNKQLAEAVAKQKKAAERAGKK